MAGEQSFGLDDYATRLMFGMAAGNRNAQAKVTSYIEDPIDPSPEELREAFDAITRGYRTLGDKVRVASVSIDRFGSIFAMTRVKREPYVWVRKGRRKTKRLPGWVPVRPVIRPNSTYRTAEEQRKLYREAQRVDEWPGG